MCDCFPKSGGNIILSDACTLPFGASEYAAKFKQWNDPVLNNTFPAPQPQFSSAAAPWNQRYAFSKGARFGVPPNCVNRISFRYFQKHSKPNLFLHKICQNRQRKGCFSGLHSTPGTIPIRDDLSTWLFWRQLWWMPTPVPYSPWSSTSESHRPSQAVPLPFHDRVHLLKSLRYATESLRTTLCSAGTLWRARAGSLRNWRESFNFAMLECGKLTKLNELMSGTWSVCLIF